MPSKKVKKSKSANGNDPVRPKEVKNISEYFNDRARPILNLIDDLRVIGVQKCVPIPQIAVMGDQSSGKSSVLEAISGISFPRSAGLCTRCPTQVTMTEGPVWSAMIRSNQSEGITLEDGQQDTISEVIEQFTTKLAGEKDKGGFSNADEYIEIQLTSPDVPDLTIIDLPGIIRTSTAGQSEEAKAQVDGMLERFLKQERTIILAVIPANVDIATVDILERAKKVDPEFKRTIGVLTKPDLVDRGAENEVIEVLANRRKPMLHGYFMVKNRSQQELDANESQELARRRELEWLFTSKYVDAPGVSKSRLGVERLTRALTQLLVERIEEAIPAMTKEVDAALKKASGELALLGKPPPKSAAQCRVALGEIISSFSRTFRKTCSEAFPVFSDSEEIDSGALYKELRLRKEFVREVKKSQPGFDGEDDRYNLKVTNTLNPGSYPLEPSVVHHSVNTILDGIPIAGDDVDSNSFKVDMVISVSYRKNGFSQAKIIEIDPCFRAEIAKKIEDRRGREMPGFKSFPVFCELMKGFIERWQYPMESFHSQVLNAWTETAMAILRSTSSEWPRVMRAIEAEILKYIEETEKTTSTRLEEALELEKVPSTENKDLYQRINKYRNDRTKKVIENISTRTIDVDTVLKLLQSSIGVKDSESAEVQEMIDYLKAYWNLAHMRFIDMVCKIVSESYTGEEKMETIEKRLIFAIVHNAEGSELQRLFQSNPGRESRRYELQMQIKDLRKAQDRIRRGVDELDC